MRALIQRVTSGAVTIDGETAGRVGKGYVILLGVTHTDTPEDADFVADKCFALRIFEDDNGKMNRSVSDVGGGALVVSQFTLYADTSTGRRPSFSAAARPELAIPCYERFVGRLRENGLPVETGRFGADMQLEIHNDGPVTVMIESKTK